jgi:hypothetical protein
MAWAIGIGVAFGLLGAASPLLIVDALLFAAILLLARRGLPDDERTQVTWLLATAALVRVAVVGALLIVSARTNTDHSAGILFGDEAYTLMRSLRRRDILLGFPVTQLDYDDLFDAYGWTRYTPILSWIQLVFGPSPYSARLLNAVSFLGGAVLLYRCARIGFGRYPALAGLAALVFLPSWIIWSTTLMKESVYFLLTATAIAAGMAIVRARPWAAKAAAAALLGACTIAVVDFRPAAALLVGGGVALGLVAYALMLTRTSRRMVAAGAVVAAVTIAVAPGRLLVALQETAKQHTGHVFTVGHAYKTLDDKFYATANARVSNLTLTPAEASRYVARSFATFIVTPLPWQTETRSELVFIPQQLVWYAFVVLSIVAARTAWRRDRLFLALLAGAVAPTSLAVALTNGNVGTLIRLRDVVTPLWVWTAALGAVVAMQWLVDERRDAV